MQQKFYDIVDSVISEDDNFSNTTEATKLEMTDEIRELFINEDYTLSKLKKHVRDNLATNDDSYLKKYDITEEELNDFKVIAKELSWDLVKDVLERKEDIQIYDYDNEDEFVEFLLMDFLILGEIPDAVFPYIDLKHVWNALVRFSFYQTKVGFVYTEI